MTSSEAYNRLEVLINFLRKKGVVQFSSGDLALSIMPDAPTVEDALAKPEPGIVTKVVRGRDGLTSEEQLELYGRPMDAKG